MAVTRGILAVLLFFAFYAVSKIESTTILMSAVYKKVNVLITNDLSQFVIISGPGLQIAEVPKKEKLNLMFEGSGFVRVTEGEKMIFETEVGYGILDLVRTHSNAHLKEVLGDITINQKDDQLNLNFEGDERKKHNFTLIEDNSAESKQMVNVIKNKITVRQAPDQDNQNFKFHGVFEDSFSLTLDKPGEMQNIEIRGLGSHTTTMRKDNGITIVSRLHYER